MLRHCTIEELLELRDGEGSASARTHLSSCEECRVEFERLHQRVAALRSLPSFTAPRDRWPIVRETLAATRRHQRAARVGWSVLAAAAALVLLIGVRSITGSGPETLAAQEVESLVQESQELEDVLQEYYRQGRVVNAATAAAIADLEDRIAVIDLGIERAQAASVPSDDMADLWRERVALMDQLVTTHVRPVTYVAY